MKKMILKGLVVGAMLCAFATPAFADVIRVPSAVDPLSLVLPNNVYVRLTLPDPPPDLNINAAAVHVNN